MYFSRPTMAFFVWTMGLPLLQYFPPPRNISWVCLSSSLKPLWGSHGLVLPAGASRTLALLPHLYPCLHRSCPAASPYSPSCLHLILPQSFAFCTVLNTKPQKLFPASYIYINTIHFAKISSIGKIWVGAITQISFAKIHRNGSNTWFALNIWRGYLHAFLFWVWTRPSGT